MTIHFVLISLIIATNIDVSLGDSSGLYRNYHISHCYLDNINGVLKVLGGSESDPHSRPWMGQLFYEGNFLCGLSLISDRYALTAAHCVSRGILIEILTGW